MSRPNTDAQPHEPLYFNAQLTPHRSLGRRGFIFLMIAVCAISFIAGLAFYLAGAWPVVGFFGLDVALIYGAFRINYRRARTYETLRLSRSDLLVEHVNHWGQKRIWRFQPYWLQVLMDEPAAGESHLILRSHGQNLEIAGFLPPAERSDLARALRTALARARAACAPCPPCAPAQA
jgi:uncharacterized membrane protein